jgi:hypothetical protein
MGRGGGRSGGRGGGFVGGGNGGIGGSGIFGMVGSTVLCKSDDNSWYCSITKFITLFFQIILFLAVVYFIVSLAYPYVKSKVFGKGR